ncbi:MAG TPA: ribonuclease J [Clostridia bacterium]|nr:ribonuclease J [Clostridia bacterium]HPQ45868.1 ribonuclease J [Clostridia bacterium]
MADKRSLRVIPLGGIQEIGKNITVFEYDGDMIVVDCGIIFPEDEMLGIDVVIPDFSYITDNMEKLRGLVLTHGHEDHIGAVPYLLKEVNVPVFGTAMTLGLLEYKLQEHGLLDISELNVVEAGDAVGLGCFTVEFINSNHSIADSAALAIKTPVGTVIHTSDFKIDYTPIAGKPMNLQRIAELGEEGVRLLLADSTNVEQEGFTISERVVGESFERIFSKAEGRIIVATFASNVHRVQQIVNAAIKFNKKIIVFGRSMHNVMKKSTELGYLQIPPGTIVDPEDMDSYKPGELVFIATGSQGEPMSALSRMAMDTHRNAEIKKGDLVIISASAIPGNEKPINQLINGLLKRGAEVIYESISEIHSSGHACREELKLIHNLVSPEYFMPVHGEYRHLKRHADLAASIGMKEENIFIMENGRVLEVSRKGARINGSVQSGYLMVDGLGIGDVGNIVLRDRKHLSQDGLITVVLTIEKATGEILAGPDVSTRGFVYEKESGGLIGDIKNYIYERLAEKDLEAMNSHEIKTFLKKNLRDYLYRKTGRNPMILPIVMEI